MSAWLEIILPVRNPGWELLETGVSLSSQTERGFGIVLSDNFSTAGKEIVARFSDEMKSAGIPLRQIQPPRELRRVPHWNWTHGQAEAEWLKPLSAGELLKSNYVERLRRCVEARPQAQIVRCEFEILEARKIHAATAAPFKQEHLTPAEFLDYFPAGGNWIGGAVNLAYRRAAWQANGGWPPHLPALGGAKLGAALALRHGIEIIRETLATQTQRPVCDVRNCEIVETWLMLCGLRNYCLSVNLPWPEFGVVRGVIGSFIGKF